MKFEYHRYEHHKPSPQVLGALAEIKQLLLSLQTQVGTLMTKADFDTVISAINDETNTLAAKLDALNAKLNNPAGLSAEDAQAVLGEIQAVSTRLTGLAADQNNPVPPPAPPAPPAPATTP